MQIVGYGDRLSVQPGETVRFMVSCQLPSYRADIVRLIHGDENPEGPGFKEVLVNAAVNGEYPGRDQPLRAGSYVRVPDSPLLRPGDGFTLQCWIYPTTPQKGPQGILTKQSVAEGNGYGLYVNPDGSLALWIGDQAGRVQRVSTATTLQTPQWYFAAGGYDPVGQRLFVYLSPAGEWTGTRSPEFTEEAAYVSTPGENSAPFLMAGYDDRDASGKPIVAGHFNGKIESPRLFSRALTPDEVRRLASGAAPSQFGDNLAAAWDFSREVSSARIVDSSPNQLHGTAVNMPARAMTGHNWESAEVNFNHAPQQYGAIYFHDDDLEDASWEADFEFTVPKDMKSGVYAARLRASEDNDGEDYVPFGVRPKRGTASAGILLLLPTASYLAYANYYGMRDLDVLKEYEEWSKRTGFEIKYTGPPSVQDTYIADHSLLSLYDLHSDGSGVCYSSRLRPILNMRPKYHMQGLAMGEGAPHQFNADLHLVDWLEAKGYQFDVATDEDLQLEGDELLAHYRVVLTGSHPEYWSGRMLAALESYVSRGGRLMYLGGNGFYWVTSFAPHGTHVIEVRRWHGTEAWEAAPGEYYHSTTGEIGGLWRFRGKPPQRLAGVGFTAQGVDASLPYRRQPDSFDPRAAFIFEGVGEDEVIGDFGLVMGGAGGFELDRADPALGTPAHALVLATTTGFSDVYQHVIEEVSIADSQQGGAINPLVKGDMVYFETSGDGAVFSVGSIAWCGSLSHANYDNNVSRITANVLNKFTS